MIEYFTVNDWKIQHLTGRIYMVRINKMFNYISKNDQILTEVINWSTTLEVF